MTYVKNNLRGVIGPNFGIAKADIDASNLTAARSYVLPDSSGQIALSSHSHSYLSLTDTPTNIEDQIAREASLAAKRIALTAIAMTKSTGGQWGTVFGDEFTDETRIASKTGATFTTGYYHNQGGSGSQVPAMTSATAPSGVVSTNDEGIDAAWKAFDGNDGTAWWANGTAAYVQYDFGAGNAKTITQIVLLGDGSRLKDFTLKGSTDNSNWTNLHSATHPQSSSSQTYSITNSTAYRYYRLDVANTYSGSVKVLKLDMHGASGATDMTLISTAVSELRSGTVKSFLIGLEYEPIDAVTLGADLKLYASRDNGNTWTEATYSPALPFLSGKTLCTADADISTQPEGSSLKWKLTTHNTKQIKIHGITIYPSME